MQELFVTKKNGTSEKWDFLKILDAIKKSAKRVDVGINSEELKQIKRRISRRVRNKTNLTVLEIHNIVEAVLKDIVPKVGKSYSDYRNYKKSVVESFEKLYQQTKDTLYIGDRENANFNSALSSTKGSLIRGYLTKDLFQKFYLSKNELQASKDGYVYFHDLRDLLLGNFNCCLFDIEAVLNGGFEMSGIKYKEPKSVLSAAQVIGDITLVATAQQYGGFTISEFDKVLVPYCEKSFITYKNEALLYGINDVEKYAEDKTTEELRQGIQSIEMKLNTVPSSRGDTAFVTISFGNVDGSVNKKWQREVCHIILETRMNGQGNGSPVLFPKLVYLHSEKQHKDKEQENLFDKAIKCCSKAMYPDFLSLDNSEIGDIYASTGKVVSPMGCRSYLSDFKGEGGESFFVGRGNIGVASLNLPMIWSKSSGKRFWQDVDKYLEIIRQFHIKRYEYISNNLCSTNPLAFTQGGMHGGTKQPSDKIGMDIMKAFTASFGITALNELNVLMEGIPLHKSNRKLINEVVNYIHDKVEEFKKVDGHLYSLYGVPAESLAGTQLQQYRKMFGVVEGVSDKEYFTNSFHCHVSADITPFEKQDMEHELFHKINGGHIQYVRLDNPNNLEAIKAVVKRGMSMGFYQGINFDLVVCEDCGHRPQKFKPTCDLCGSENITVISRLCGYLGFKYTNGNTRVNDSKLCEMMDRVSM